MAKQSKQLKKRMKVGRPRNIENPEDLLSLWEQYKKSVDSNPDKIEQATPKGDVVSIKVKKPYLKQGFEAFVFRLKGFTIGDYLRGDYEEFSHVVTCIRNEWENDQVSGTLTGRYKAPNLVARLNGLVDKQEREVKQVEIFKGIDLSVKEDNGTKE